MPGPAALQPRRAVEAVGRSQNAEPPDANKAAHPTPR